MGSYDRPVPHAPTAHGRGLQLLDLDQDAGSQVEVLTQVLVNPAFLATHPRLPVLYAVSESWTAPGDVTSLRLDDKWTEVRDRRSLPSGGRIPSYVAVVGGHLLLSNYGDGSVVSFGLDGAGELTEQCDQIRLAGSGPDIERQDGPHTHCVLQHPSNGSVYVADLGADLLLRLRVDGDSGTLEVAHELGVPAGSGPRHLVFSRDGTQVLLVEELSSTLAVFTVRDNGDLQPSDRLSLLPKDFAGTSFGADIVISPDGDTVFVSNRGHDSVVTIRRHQDSWQAVDWTPTGSIPRGLALAPSGDLLLVACQEDDLIDAFRVTAGGLVRSFQLPSATPTCIRFLDRSR